MKKWNLKKESNTGIQKNNPKKESNKGMQTRNQTKINKNLVKRKWLEDVER